MKNLNLFVSIPMANRTEFTIKKVMAKATKEVAAGFEGSDIQVTLLNSYFEEELSPLEFLGKSIMLMAKADVVYFCKGWSTARGCKVEYEAARLYNKMVILESD